MMNPKYLLPLIGCLWAVFSSARSEPLPHDRPPALQGEGSIADLGTQLAGTTWRAVPKDHTHPGLVSVLTFTEDTVAPEGYHYDVNSPDSITIHFNHGGIQKIALSADGRHLQFTFKQSEFAYELVKQGENEHFDLKTQLAGTTWRAVPVSQTHPGLASTISFTQDTVAPEGYHYEVDSADSITIHFNHGGTQLLVLAADGKRFKFVFNKKPYEYERVSK